jgi:hypothetical protein
MRPVDVRNNEIAGPDGRRDWYDSTLIPLVRDGTWQTLDAYVERTADESVTRGLCPACESATGAGG